LPDRGILGGSEALSGEPVDRPAEVSRRAILEPDSEHQAAEIQKAPARDGSKVRETSWDYTAGVDGVKRLRQDGLLGASNVPGRSMPVVPAIPVALDVPQGLLETWADNPEPAANDRMSR